MLCAIGGSAIGRNAIGRNAIGRAAVVASLSLLAGIAVTCASGRSALPESYTNGPGTLLAYTVADDGFAVARLDLEGAMIESWPAQGISPGFRVSTTGTDLAVLRSTSTEQNQLTTLDLTSGESTSRSTRLFSIDWSTDGRLFGVEEMPTGALAGMVAADGSGVDPTGAITLGGAGMARRFSEDEMLVALSESSDGSDGSDASGTDRTALVRVGFDGTRGRSYPVPEGCDAYGWETSPDQQRIAVSLQCSSSGGSGLQVIDSETGEMTHMVKGLALSPSWSPDGRRLAYTANESQPDSSAGLTSQGLMDGIETSAVWVLSPDDGSVQRITEPDGRILTPKWAPGV